MPTNPHLFSCLKYSGLTDIRLLFASFCHCWETDASSRAQMAYCCRAICTTAGSWPLTLWCLIILLAPQWFPFSLLIWEPVLISPSAFKLCWHFLDSCFDFFCFFFPCFILNVLRDNVDSVADFVHHCPVSDIYISLKEKDFRTPIVFSLQLLLHPTSTFGVSNC